MANKILIPIIAFILLAAAGLSCKKYLDLKPDKKLTVPTTVKDLQALLDNTQIMNNKSPSYDEASADNYFFPSGNYLQEGKNARNAYVWENYDYNYPNDWNVLYDGVYYANEVLNGLEKVERTANHASHWDNVKGSALVFRANNFLKAAWIFAKAYDEETADTDLGIVLRTDPDFDKVDTRASVKATYEKIINDLEAAAPLLPDRPVHVMRPSKPAAYALLARTYLSMGLYDKAFKYSDLSLGLNNKLINYNTENIDDMLFPFRQFNEEVVWNQTIDLMNYTITPGIVMIDSVLYKSYDDNDLRKRAFYLDASIFFPDIRGYLFKGTYMGDFGSLFTGITTAEMYLIRAECYARAGGINDAMADINTFMKNRWNNQVTFPVFSASSKEEALNIVLTERRKELVFRGLRWMDIKRLNKEGANIVLKRVIEGKTYTLQPNENRYALPLPADIIQMTSIQQNPK
ncbi:MAG: RagB/SusD family nutrient uptake outer membrane protein [Ginsengibacter sp.]